MKQYLYQFLLLAIVTVTPLLLSSTAYANGISQSIVAEGRALLFDNGNYTTEGFIAANEKFKEAVTADSTDSEARLFLSITRIPALLDNAANYTSGLPIENFREFFDNLGVDATGRDIFDWSAQFSKDINGDIILPSNVPNFQDFQNFIKTVIIQEINNALTDLTYIPDSFSTILTSSETGVDQAIDVDYGDVLVYKTTLYSLKTFLYIITSYDLNFGDPSVAVTKIKDELFNVNKDLLDLYPQFLNLLADGALSIQSARNSLLTAIDSYNQASEFIRNEVDVQNDDLFSLDIQSQASESDFRANLETIRISLVDKVPVNINQSPEINFSYFFEDPINLRDQLPAIEYDPYSGKMLDPDICTIADRTFSGILPDGLTDCITPPGDIDHTGKVDIKDALIALKILTGAKNKGFSDADADNDTKIGIAEVIYVMQKISGLAGR